MDRTDVALKSWEHLAGTVSPFIQADTRVAEMGCWTGTLACWLGLRYPEATIIGIDRAANLIAAGLEQELPENVQLVSASYDVIPPELEPFDVILTSLGIDFEQMPHGQTDPIKETSDNPVVHMIAAQSVPVLRPLPRSAKTWWGRASTAPKKGLIRCSTGTFFICGARRSM